MDDTHAYTTVIHRIRSVAYETPPDFPSALLRGKRTPAGFVLLFTADFHPVEPANLFLIDRCKGSNNTQKSYADDLAQWWTYLHFNELVWDDVTNEDIRDYQEALTQAVSVKTSRDFASATIERRIVTVIEFYRWAHQQNFITSPIASVPAKRHFDLDRRGLPHVGGRTNGFHRTSARSRQPDEDVDPISVKHLARILSALGPDPHTLDEEDDLSDEKDTRPVRDRLMAEIAVYTGMRVGEICGLNVYQILDLRNEVVPTDPFKPIKLRIEVTKGGNPRIVIIPSILVSALLDYIDGERSQVLDQARERGRFRAGREPSALFINHLSASTRNIGNPVKEATAMRAFTRAVRTCGLKKTVLGYEMDPETGAPAIDPDTGETIPKRMEVPKHTFHDLRHTYAVQYYWSQIQHGNPNPWKKLQAFLGHQRLTTTTDIYGRHVQVDEPQITDGHAQMLKRHLDALT